MRNGTKGWCAMSWSGMDLQQKRSWFVWSLTGISFLAVKNCWKSWQRFREWQVLLIISIKKRRMWSWDQRFVRSGDRRISPIISVMSNTRFHRCLSIRWIRYRQRYFTEPHWNTPGLLEKRRFGMCIVVSERFPFSLRRKHRKFTAWKSCRRQLRMQSIMLRSMRLQTRSFL